MLKLDPAAITPETIKTEEFAISYNYLVSLLQYANDLKHNVDEAIKAAARDHYLETGDNTLFSPEYRYTYVPGTTRESFNVQQFKVDDPMTYRKYVKVSQVNDSLRATKLKVPSSEEAPNGTVVIPD